MPAVPYLPAVTACLMKIDNTACSFDYSAVDAAEVDADADDVANDASFVRVVICVFVFVVNER